MKVVVCENCGAKYQLNDDDDINAFECSNCSGSLKELESFSDEEIPKQSDDSSGSDSVLVYCINCGLKFQIEKDDNINDFECASCGGPLDYLSNKSEESQESQISQDSQGSDSYYETVSYVQSDEAPIGSDFDEIVPIHADPNYSDSDEIIPIHADPNYSDSDDIIPIHAESDSQTQYYEELIESDEIYANQYEDDDQYYVSEYEEVLQSDADSYYEDEYDDQYYQTDLQEEGSGQISLDELYYTSEYPAYDGTDEIIPIHAEKRYMEDSQDSGFAYGPNGKYAEDYLEEEYIEEDYVDSVEEESPYVEVIDIPEDELPETPVVLTRQVLSEEDQRLFDRVQNQMVFDSPEEYEAFKAARYKYYVGLLDILKEEYLLSMENEFKSGRSVKNLIKKGGETVKQSNLYADDSDSLVSPETVELMKSNRKYEPKKSNADVIIIAGFFIAIVSLAYYFFVSQIMYVLIAFALGLVILAYGAYKKYVFNEYIARGRIIRERLLALPNDFYVFYAVQPPQSKDIINHVVVGPTGIFTILSQRYDSKDYKNKLKSDTETGDMLSESASIQDYRQKKNTLELQTDYDDNQSRFQFGNEEIHFTQNSQIKRKALELNEDLAIFLDKKGFNGIYIEPLIGFVNDDLAILNVILTNEDLFIDELFNKVIRGRRRLDELTVAKIARLLSYYSANCDVY